MSPPLPGVCSGTVRGCPPARSMRLIVPLFWFNVSVTEMGIVRASWHVHGLEDRAAGRINARQRAVLVGDHPDAAGTDRNAPPPGQQVRRRTLEPGCVSSN